jgi:hypothetical protein
VSVLRCHIFLLFQEGLRPEILEHFRREERVRNGHLKIVSGCIELDFIMPKSNFTIYFLDK